MSPLTLFIAKFIGLMFSHFFVVDGDEQASHARRDRRAGAQSRPDVDGGSFNLAAGLAIVLGHNLWSSGALTVVVTLIGWLVALRKRLQLRRAGHTCAPR